MTTDTPSSGDAAPRSIAIMLRDWVFGEPMPQPVVHERDDEQAWQDWLNAVADQEAVIEFEDTQPLDAR